MQLPENTVALVTGASRGIGKGTAIALAKEGAVVYITARTIHGESSGAKLAGSLSETAKEIHAFGGTCIPIQCDHTDDHATEKVFAQISAEQGKLDVLVNAVWGGYEHFTDGTEFWKEAGFWDMPFERWDKMFTAGVRAHFVASSLAARLMIPRGNGLIVNLSFWPAEKNDQGTAYSVAKAATNKMTECMGFELRDKNITVLTLYPGLVRTEAVMANKDFFNLENSESPEFTGRVICALLQDRDLFEKSGKRFVSAALAETFNITDVDGKKPIPLTIETC